MENEECFYGITLSGANATYTWDVSKDEDGDVTQTQRLVIKNLLLGHEAKSDEYNVVEAQAPSADGKVIKIPIAVLKVGETRSMNPHLEFPDGPVTFKLISGAGPVHLHGLQGNGVERIEMDEEEEMYPEEEEDEAEEAEAEAGGPKKKIKLAANNGKAAAAAPANNKKK